MMRYFLVPPLTAEAGTYAAAATVSRLDAATSEDLPLPRQLATGTPRRALVQRTEAPEHGKAHHELLDPEVQRRQRGTRVWLAEQVELLASSIYPPRSPAVASHAPVTMLTTLCFLLPRNSGPATRVLAFLLLPQQLATRTPQRRVLQTGK